MMPPTRLADTSPPNILPLTVTPIASMPMIGNLPSSSSDGWMRMPCDRAGDLADPSRPWMPVTLAERMSTKSSGALSTSSHWMPIASMRTGRKVGHLNESPVAEPTERKTPNPGSALKEPSPRIAKLRPSPPSTSEPIVTFAPTAPNCTMMSEPVAPVSRRKSRAVRVT